MPDEYRWRVILEGHKFDLEDLPLWLIGFNPTVKKIEGEYALLGAALDALGTVDEVRRLAFEMVSLINGLGRLVWSRFQPISVGKIVRVEPGGKRQGFVHLEGTVRARGKMSATVIKADGTIQAHEPTSGALVGLIDRARADTRAQRLVEIFGHAELTWSDLYKAVEVVEEAVGNSIHDNGWASKREIKRLKRTAQCYEILGRDARHAKSFRPPSNPLSFDEAKAIVLRIAGEWLRGPPPIDS